MMRGTLEKVIVSQVGWALYEKFFRHYTRKHPAGGASQFPNDHAYTRILEVKHITGQTLPVTTIVREYPEDYGPGREPYYPLPTPDARALYGKHAAMAEAEPNVSFVGRMATCRYYNMDQVVGMALTEFERLCDRLPN